MPHWSGSTITSKQITGMMMSDFEFTPVTQPDPTSPVSFMDLFKSMNNIAEEKPPFIGCLYSEPGAGKSTAAIELAQRLTPPDQKILYVYTAQNWASIQNFPELKNRVKAIQFTKWEQLEAIGDLINNEAMMEKTKIGAVVFDEFNTMVETVLDLLTQHRASIANTGPKMYSDKTKREIFKDPHTPEWPEYGSVKTRIIEIMTAITSANIHAIFTAHTRMQKKRTRWEPDIFDTGAQAFMRALHSLYFIEADDDDANTKRTFLLQPAGNRTAKNRIGQMGKTAKNVKEIADAYHVWGDWGDQGMLSDLGEIPDRKAAVPVKAIEPPVETEINLVEASEVQDSLPQKEEEAEKPDLNLDSLFDE